MILTTGGKLGSYEIDSILGSGGLGTILHYGIQLADALAKAHSAGIAHRDLKPDNVMVTEDGLVIILDFGLAKLIEPADLSEASTRDMGRLHTKESHLVGTAPYMSPEQAQGLRVDGRSDIFSFGSVLYEMVTGRRAFSEQTMVALLGAIVKTVPKRVSELAPSVPLDLDRVITRALRKEKERRFQSMTDMKIELVEIKEKVDSGSAVSAAQALVPGARRSEKSRWVAWAAVAMALVLLVGIVGYFLLS